MATIYRWNINPFSDFLLNSLIYGIDISERKLKPDINGVFTSILQDVLEDQEDVAYLDFSITKKENFYKVKGKNAISALWLSAVLPSNPTDIFKHNIFVFGDREYAYDRKTKVLTFKTVKN
jgi:hypothetical protein